MSIQAKMKQALEQASLPYKEIDVYGRQIVVTCWSRDAAEKWGHLLARFAKLRCIIHSRDEAKRNVGGNLCPTMVDVWRTFAQVA